MIKAHETFNGTWPFKPNFFKAPGFKMHYVDEGEGEPILCLHGEPTWGYIYRNLIGPLSKTNRVIVPDHMGFGKSETPQDKVYTLKTHVENVTALINELGLEDINLVIDDWGGVIGGHLLAIMPDRIKRVCISSTIPMPFCDVSEDYEELMDCDWFRFVSSDSREAVLNNFGYTALSIMKLDGIQDNSILTDDWIRAYSAAFENKEECKGVAAFPLDLVNGTADYLDPPTEEVATKVRAKPAVYISGNDDRALPPNIAIKMFRQAFGDQPVVELPNCGHFCPEDAPKEVLTQIQALLKR